MNLKEKEEFGRKLKRVFTGLMEIQARLLELEEFEKQWKEIFARLQPTFGHEVQIRIADQGLYRLFTRDKYRLVCLDFHSLLVNEMAQGSASHQAEKFVKVKTLDDLLAEELEKDVVIFDLNGEREETKKKDPLFAKIFAHERREHYTFLFRELFGEAQTPAERWEILKQNIRDLKSKSDSLRILFAHRYEVGAQKKHSAGFASANVTELRSWLDSVFGLFNSISILNSGTQYVPLTHNFKRSVSDQIDLMLFGTISRAIQTFDKHFKDEEKDYCEKREEFFDAVFLYSIVVPK